MTLFTRRRPSTRAHFIGVGGIGMSGIAEILIGLGCRVSGSDRKLSDVTERLRSLGAEVREGHTDRNLDLLDGELDVVVISSAVSPDNPEVVGAHARGIPVVRRAEMLAELMRLRYGIAIAGSHGKTTTSSLIATVLYHAGLDPTAVIGGKLPALGSNARLGRSEYLVAEADESDGSFLHLMPTVAVVTNIDPEHLDHYGDFDRLLAAFRDFVDKVPFYGRAVLCQDHPTVRAMIPSISKKVITYGLTLGASYRAEELMFSGLSSRFIALSHGERLGPVEVPMPGAHNVQNALAALAVSEFLGIPFATFQEAMRSFGGVGRRFTVKGRVIRDGDEIMVVDDYGHHPAEVRATIAGARTGFPGRRLVVAFQPHRYTRTRDLLDEFSRAFDDADVVLIADIYGAGETPIPEVSSQVLAQRIRTHGHPAVRYVGARTHVATELCDLVLPGDIVVTLGAGDISHSGPELLSLLGAR
jgi:UDP-N-acetylmuramate--alanine ligase